ncbi:DNA helicase [Armatimonas sp.]|uniref:DNA helicase n=1 Tax=Armatimonas sp. TaxID=1872638 RepID=UPI00286A543C|nr:DNA helicase [Armatimonas sp.]
MQLSAPLYILKQQAKVLTRRENIPLHQALDQIARREGFTAWSLLSAKTVSEKPTSTLFAQLRPGELVLLGSRPGQGKTLLSLDLALQTLRRGGHAAFFTLDFTRGNVIESFKTLGAELEAFTDRFLLDDSDKICADYMIAKLATAPAKTLVIVDYLQLLDQRRENPDLMTQVQQLRSFARERQLIVICLSQINRSYDPEKQAVPGIEDVRLPNPLDLSLFDRMCFLHQGKMQIIAGG